MLGVRFQPLQQKIFSASHLCRPDNCFSEESSIARPYHLISSRLGERGGCDDKTCGVSGTCLFGRKLAVSEEIQPLGDCVLWSCNESLLLLLLVLSMLMPDLNRDNRPDEGFLDVVVGEASYVGFFRDLAESLYSIESKLPA